MKRYIYLVLCFLFLGVAEAQFTPEKIRYEDIGCTTREQLEKLISYLLQKDEEAYQRSLKSSLSNKSCTFFKVGEIVYVMGGPTKNLVRLRRKGETNEYWTTGGGVQNTKK